MALLQATINTEKKSVILYEIKPDGTLMGTGNVEITDWKKCRNITMEDVAQTYATMIDLGPISFGKIGAEDILQRLQCERTNRIIQRIAKRLFSLAFND